MTVGVLKKLFGKVVGNLAVLREEDFLETKNIIESEDSDFS